MDHDQRQRRQCGAHPPGLAARCNSLSIAFLAIVALLCAAQAKAGPRVYFFRGWGGAAITTAPDAIAQELRRQGATVFVDDFWRWAHYCADGIEHRAAALVCIGHSFGGDACISMARALAKSGVRMRVVTVDPTRLVGAAPRGMVVTNFYRAGAIFGGGYVAGARNIVVTGSMDHVGMIADHWMQRQIIDAAIE